jgi:hypothetical protein
LRFRLDHLSILQGYDCIGMGQRFRAVGDDQDGVVRGKQAGGLTNPGFVGRVEVAGGFVEDHQAAWLEESAGEGQALGLTGRQASSALANDRVEAFRQSGDELICARQVRSLGQLFGGSLWIGKAQIGGDGVIEQVGSLRSPAQGGAPGSEGNFL